MGAPDHHHVTVRPRMSGPNTHAIGARVQVTLDDHTTTRLISAGTSYMGQEPAEALFGAGDQDRAQRITVRWGLTKRFSVQSIPTWL